MHDTSNIRRIVETYSDMILRIAYQHTFNMHDAEDIAQEVFLSIIKQNMKNYTPEHEKAYIIKATINKCKSFHRKNNHINMVYLDDIYQNQNEPDFTNQEQTLLDEIRMLDKKYRDVLYLYYYEGYKASEIAKILGTTTGTVTSQLKRGREKLKILLKEENYG